MAKKQKALKIRAFTIRLPKQFLLTTSAKERCISNGRAERGSRTHSPNRFIIKVLSSLILAGAPDFPPR